MDISAAQAEYNTLVSGGMPGAQAYQQIQAKYGANTFVQDMVGVYPNGGTLQAGVNPYTAGTYGTTSGSGGGSTSPYTAAQLDAALTAHQNAVKSINRAYEAGLLNFQQQQIALDHTRAQSLQDLQVSKDAADNSNSSYFSQVSPDAYQSQQGNYSDKILNSYNQGVSNTNTEANNNQTLINSAKDNFNQANQDAITGENAAYNAGGGAYLGKDYGSSLQANVPALQAFTTNTNAPRMAAPGIAAYSPNAQGGMSTLQAGQNPQDQNLQRFLNGR